MKELPDFFLSAAAEMSGDLAALRACWIKGRMRGDVRDDHMLIEVEPPVIGQTYGLGGEDIANLVLSAHYRGDRLFPVKKWPCHVYVTRIVDQSVTKTLTFTRGQLELIGWGMIFRTIQEAYAELRNLPIMAAELSPDKFVEFRVPSMRFVGEQDGPPEHLLKDRLCELFHQDKTISAAYLARAVIGNNPISVVLGLRATGHPDRRVIEKVGSVFASIFSAKQHLDIVFLSRMQEAALKEVCRSFFLQAR